MTSKQKSALLAIIFFLLMALPVAIVIIKEKIFTPKEVHVITTDTVKQATR